MLDHWYSNFENFLLLHNLHNCPSQIWNCDESGFSLCPKSGRVLASQGVRYVHQVSSSSRLQITTMVCASAAGSTIPPMHIFAGERFSYNPLANGVEGVYFGKFIDGWITNHFVRHISPERPVSLIVDGHSSHIDLDTSKFCEANGILLYCLPPHSSQPLDVGLFSPLKKSWQHAVAEFQYETGEFISKQTFARVFRIACMKSVRMPHPLYIIYE